MKAPPHVVCSRLPDYEYLGLNFTPQPLTLVVIYKSGSVTQSGPGGELMHRAYCEFMTLIVQLRPYIEYYPQTQNNLQLMS